MINTQEMVKNNCNDFCFFDIHSLFAAVLSNGMNDVPMDISQKMHNSNLHGISDEYGK